MENKRHGGAGYAQGGLAWSCCWIGAYARAKSIRSCCVRTWKRIKRRRTSQFRLSFSRPAIAEELNSKNRYALISSEGSNACDSSAPRLAKASPPFSAPPTSPYALRLQPFPQQN